MRTSKPKYLSTALLLALMIFGSPAPSRADWQSLGPYGGHALKVVIDPQDSTHLFVATKNGQVYESRDGGEHWVPLPFRLDKAGSLHAIVLHPSDSRTIYIGVADNSEQTQGASNVGVYRSQDGGQSWLLLASTAHWSVLSLAIHPRQPQIIVAGTMQGVYRSGNGAADWTRISPVNHPELKGIVSLALDPADPRVIYAGTPHLPWRTDDGGRSWTSIHQGMIDDSDVFSITVDRTNSQRIFASACSGIYQSHSRGNQWTKMQGIPGTNRRTHVILQDPSDEKTIYAGTTQGLWKSQDGGVSWRKTNSYPYVINSIAIDPTNHERLYLATDRSGILKSHDGGATFQMMNEGFVNRNIGGLIGEETLYLSSLYDGDFGGLFSSTDGGRSWKLNANQGALKGKNVISLAVSPANSRLLYAGTYEGLLRSDDGGMNWYLVTGSGLGTARVSKKPAASPRSSLAPAGVRLPQTKVYDVKFLKHAETVYVATAQGVFESSDGIIWRKHQDLASGGAVYRLVLHPTDPAWLMAHASRGMYVSDNRGQTWRETRVGDVSVRIHDSAFGDSTPVRLLAGTSHGLFESTDGGGSWKAMAGLPMIPVNHFCTSRSKPELMYFLSQLDNQVYQSIDGGTNWSRFDDGGLKGLSIQSMASGTRQGGDLLVLSENRGVWIYTPPQAAALGGSP